MWGSDQVTALVINVNQQAIDAPGFDLATYITARSNEINYLKAVAASPNPQLGHHSVESINSMLAEATAEFHSL